MKGGLRPHPIHPIRKKQEGKDEKLKRILFVATVPIHFRYFHLPCFRMLQEHGYEVHTVCCEAEDFPYSDKQFAVPMGRNPFDPKNREALRTLRRIIREGDYDIVHGHTPVGGLLTRLAARGARKNGTRVFYTAHGFHFYKGAPLMNWLIFLPIEWTLSFMTDTLITINREDYDRAKRLLHPRRTAYVHGVGCETDKYFRLTGDARDEARRQLGLQPDDRLVVYVAEQNENKNQSMLVRAAKALSAEFPHLRLLIVGPDNYGGAYERLAQELDAPVVFMGERDDIPQILSVCDLYAASSLREGLPRNVMEAMAAGLPVVAVENRGHRALVREGETGFLVHTEQEMCARIRTLLTDDALCSRLSQGALERVRKFSTQRVLEELAALYFDE